uniref:Uncharacterized protein n=1 Tax=viral metagenome TaxID=1070528 RepID=A0A6C0I1V9_9ZZZZ
MTKALIHRFPHLGSTTSTIYGYVFFSESDSKKYCENEQFREYVSSQIDTKMQLLLVCDILDDIQDLQILHTIYGVYYNCTQSISNITKLQYFNTKKIYDFNMYWTNDRLSYVEDDYLDYLHIVMHDIGSGSNRSKYTYLMLTIAYEKDF